MIGGCFMNIRPVSDLRNKFPDVESQVMVSNEPVFLTKNGYGTMVLMSIDQYDKLTNDLGSKLNEADELAESTTERFSLEEVVQRVKERIHEG